MSRSASPGNAWHQTIVKTLSVSALLTASLVACDGSGDGLPPGAAGTAGSDTGGGAAGDGTAVVTEPAPNTPPNLLACACDVTNLCDQGCTCDIACQQTVGPAPAGADVTPLDRAEAAIYFPTGADGAIDRVTLKDDAFIESGGVGSAYAQLLAPADHAAIASPPLTLAGDVDNDGRDEAILVTGTSITVDDWNGSTLSSRVVHGYGSAPVTFDAAVGDLANDGTRQLVVSRLIGTVLAIEVLDIGVTGTATLRAATTIAGVRHHAVTIGRDRGDQPNQLYVLVGATGNQGTISKLTARRYTLANGALTAGASTALGGTCLISTASPVHGSAIVVGNLDDDPESEIGVATYCANGALSLFELDDDYPGPGNLREALSNEQPSLPSDVRDVRAFRPFLAIGRAGAIATAPPALVLGVTTSGVRGFIGAYAPLNAGDSLRRRRSASLDGSMDGAILTGMAVRDSDRDGIPEVFATGISVSIRETNGGFGDDEIRAERYFAVKLGAELDTGGRVTLADSAFSTGSSLHLGGAGPAIAVGDFDGDSVRVRKTGKVYLHTGTPFVNAVLSAPPSWLGVKGVEQANGFTSFGTSSTTGTTETRTINASASTTISAGGRFGIVDVSSSIKASVEYSSSKSTTNEISYGKETTIGPTDDVVLFRTVPYVSHEYEVVSHPIAQEIGSKITIDVPGAMVETTASLAQFRQRYGSLADTLVPPGLLHHTAGDPTTYFAPGDCNAATLASFVPASKGSDGKAVTTISNVHATSGRATGEGGSTVNSDSVAMSTQTGSATAVNLAVEMSVGAGVAGFTVETSAGIGTGWTHETTIGKDVTYVGGAGDFISGYSPETRYAWGLCVFHYANPKYGSYPVINYTVRRF